MSADESSSAYSGRPVCITGGAGFIGSHLADALVQRGADVRVIDDLSSGALDNLRDTRDRLRFVEGSILDPAALSEAMEGAEIAFHLAAMTSVPQSVEVPEKCFEVNAMGMLHVLEAARRHGVKRIVYSASSSAYGDDGEGPKSEALAPHPMSPYAAAKCAGELLVSAYAHSYGLSAVSLRYFNVFGARQQPDSPYAAVLPRFAERLIKGQKAIIYGDGTQTRDFTPVANAVHANLLAGSCTRELRGEVVNIACGRAITVLELLERTAELLGEPATHELVPPRIGDILHSRASIDEARALIGYEPVVSFEEGMKEAVAYYVRIFGQ